MWKISSKMIFENYVVGHCVRKSCYTDMKKTKYIKENGVRHSLNLFTKEIWKSKDIKFTCFVSLKDILVRQQYEGFSHKAFSISIVCLMDLG